MLCLLLSETMERGNPTSFGYDLVRLASSNSLKRQACTAMVAPLESYPLDFYTCKQGEREREREREANN